MLNIFPESFLFFISFFVSTHVICQSAEIVRLEEENTFLYKSYYADGQVKSSVGFYATKPYLSVEAFEEKLKDFKIKYHGERKEYYANGQLKEIVVYEKDKVIEFMKSFFEDGEEYSASLDILPQFQFAIEQQNAWLANQIAGIENKYKIQLKGTGNIVLEIGGSGNIKSVLVRSSDESQEKYLTEIGNRIKVITPAVKNGQNIGTRWAFRMNFD